MSNQTPYDQDNQPEPEQFPDEGAGPGEPPEVTDAPDNAQAAQEIRDSTTGEQGGY